jgi:hypothetical protein
VIVDEVPAAARVIATEVVDAPDVDVAALQARVEELEGRLANAKTLFREISGDVNEGLRARGRHDCVATAVLLKIAMRARG